LFEQFRQLGYPEIKPVPEGLNRPIWSVMIPTYNCAALLRETLKSVLAQDPGPDRMEIEVVDDASTKDDPETIARELGGARVRFYRQPRNVGAIANFNTCLLRSQGRILHILHGDDLVLPGFYAKMESLLEQNPGAGSGICRFAFVDSDGLWAHLSDLMQRKGGIYPGALEKIAASNWAQFAAVVLRRSLVEAIGGFHPSLIHAADWDLWKRAALVQPLVYEPTILACYRIFEGNDTSRLVKSGENIADTRRSIELSSRYLPHPESLAWARNAKSIYAEYALNAATRGLSKGDAETFRNQLREAFLLDPSMRWSRRHMKVRYLHIRQAFKCRLLAFKGMLLNNCSLKPVATSASGVDR
jgi:glycosyltransferase involved in cell wall biosynthesis